MKIKMMRRTTKIRISRNTSDSDRAVVEQYEMQLLDMLKDGEVLEKSADELQEMFKAKSVPEVPNETQIIGAYQWLTKEHSYFTTNKVYGTTETVRTKRTMHERIHGKYKLPARLEWLLAWMDDYAQAQYEKDSEIGWRVINFAYQKAKKASEGQAHEPNRT